jgi:hypothetical protein
VSANGQAGHVGLGNACAGSGRRTYSVWPQSAQELSRTGSLSVAQRTDRPPGFSFFLLLSASMFAVTRATSGPSRWRIALVRPTWQVAIAITFLCCCAAEPPGPSSPPSAPGMADCPIEKPPLSVRLWHQTTAPWEWLYLYWERCDREPRKKCSTTGKYTLMPFAVVAAAPEIMFGYYVLSGRLWDWEAVERDRVRMYSPPGKEDVSAVQAGVTGVTLSSKHSIGHATPEIPILKVIGHR